MSPRGVSSPYSRRLTSQPKSSRQQFSACGACRMRRVRCDLKDLSPGSSGPSPCSNCKERGLNCVDEYAEIKAVKLLRRGRRLQQVEAIYGKVKNTDSDTFPPRSPTHIPALKPGFFSSPFWAWFCTQRPVLDPNEFSQRYLAHIEGTRPIGHEGGILAMLIVLWALSFGVDESGSLTGADGDDKEIDQASSSAINLDAHESHNPSDDSEAFAQGGGKRHGAKFGLMLREILELIDFHGVMRRPTLDGVRVLLLVVPLMEDLNHLEKNAMYEAALSHTRILCNSNTAQPRVTPLPSHLLEDSVVRARIFLYAQIQEGISTALKGGHIFCRSEDVDALQRVINLSIDQANLSLASDVMIGGLSVDTRAFSLLDSQFLKLTVMPLRLSSVCCKVHDVLTGLKAVRRVEEHGLVDANGMREVWQDLEHCWHGFVAMKNNVSPDFGPVSVEHFADAWLIFIFECYNIILESLEHLALAADPSGNSARTLFHNAVSRPSSSPSSPYLSPHQLYQEARVRCIRLLPGVLRIIRFHLARRGMGGHASGLFTWDTGLVRGGCFFAGLLSANLHGDLQCLDGHEVKPEETDDCITPDDGVTLSLSALAEMQWIFSKTEERSAAIRLALERSKEKHGSQPPVHTHALPSIVRPATSYTDHGQYSPYSEKFLHPYSRCGGLSTHGRRAPPSLSINLRSPRRVESAPNTAYTTDGTGSNGWPSYTPPATASTMLSSRGSPDLRPSYKNGQDDAIFYYVPETLDHFAYTVAAQSTTPVMPDTIYQQHDLYDAHPMYPSVETTADCLGSNLSLFSPTEASLSPTGEDEGYIEMSVPDTL